VVVKTPVAVVARTRVAEEAADHVKRAIVAVAFVLASREARADECRVTAVLDGDGALVDAIDSTLRARGIATKATAACPTTTALVERRDNAIAVTITDPSGRRSTRTLDDATAAATLIESWARQDMNALALVGWIEPAAPSTIEASPRIDAVATVAPRGRTRDPLSLAVAGESSFGFDGSAWLGARANLCVRIGPVCAAATARYLADGTRSDVDVLGGVQVPVALGRRVVLVGGAGVGAGQFRSPFSRGEAMTTKTATSVRVDAHVSLAVMLSRYIGIHVGASAGLSPQAPMIIETEGDAPLDNGEPTGFVRAEIGLRIGVP
jgi:hypothetical protein